MDEIELIEKRKPREKHFLQKDGTILAKIYDSDIHYLKNGKYEEIDNTLEKRKNIYRNKKNDYRVTFKSNGKNSLVKMAKGKYYIDLKLKYANDSEILKKHTKSKIFKDILYTNIYDGVDIEYQTLSNKIKETLILKNDNYSEFTFVVDTNLDLVQEDDLIVAKNDEMVIFTIDKPFMEDASGMRCTNVNYKLLLVDDKYQIKVILDKNWLSREDVVYPVYVDPTITNESQNITLTDTYIYPGDSNDDKGKLGYLVAGVEKVNGQNRVNRTLIKFDLPIIGTGYEIIDASINLTPCIGSNNSDNPYEHLVEIHRMTSNWSESDASWDNLHNKYDPRVEYIGPTYRSTMVNNVIDAYPIEMNITGLVKKWYEDTPNYGIMIKSCNENYINDNYPLFFSKDNTISGNPKPVFIIKYRNNNGIESYWDYKEQSFSNGKAYVNTHTGNLTTIFDLGKTIGGVMPASLKLIYNTNDVVLNNKTFFGKGYKLNLEQVIEKIENSYQYIDEDGTTHYFNKKESNIFNNDVELDNFYYDEDGLDLIIEELNGQLKLIDANNNEMIFSKNANKYFLTDIRDIDNNTIRIEFNEDHSINKIVDKNNNEINIQYYGDNIIVTSSDNTVTKMNFLNDLLINIETVNGCTIFEYKEKDILSSIKDISGLKIEYEYYENIPYKIKKIMEIGTNDFYGNIYKLEYSLYETSIINNKGILETVAFNEYGNVTSRSILKGRNQIDDAYSIEKSYNNKNCLTSEMIPNRYIKNYLKNTSFESDENLFTYENGIITSFDMSNVNTGLRSLKVESSIANKSLEQTITLEKENYYTFSGYIKSDIPIQISLSYINNNGEEISSEEILDSSSNFERGDVTIYYGEDAVSELKIKVTLLEVGSINIDDIQLEKSGVVNYYNMIENSDFKEGLAGWACKASINDNDVNPSDFISVVDINNTKALKVKMDYNLGTSIEKKFNIKGKEGDTYTLSFWFKNEATIPYAPNVGSNVTIFYEPYDEDNGHCILSYTLPITNGDSWQHFVHTEKSIENFKSIIIVFHNYGSGNNFYMTNLSFYKDVTREEYHYDDSNNLISIEDQSENKDTLNYDKKNQITRITNTLGKSQIYEYDYNKKNRLLNTIYSNGLSNSITYKNGNPIANRISKKYVNEIKEGFYKIRLKGTKKYLKALLNNLVMEESDCSNNIWFLEKHEDRYKIKYGLKDNYSISSSNEFLILNEVNINNLFYLEKNDDGSYNIKFDDVEKNIVRYLNVLEDDSVKLNKYSDNLTNIDFYLEIPESLFIENNTKYTEDERFISDKVDSIFRKTSYEVNNLTGKINRVIDPRGIETKYEYNTKGQCTKVKQNNSEINYTYGSNNLLTNITQGNKEYLITYDNFMNIDTIYLNNNILTKNEYETNNGNLKKITYGNNQYIEMLYDDFERVNEIKKENDKYKFYYDTNGNISKIISNDSVSKFNYDKNNRLHLYKNDSFKVIYDYDTENFITTKEYKYNNNINKQINNFDGEKLVTTLFGEVKVNYNYDSLNRNVGKNINNIINTASNFVSNGKRTSNLINSYQVNNDIYKYDYDEVYNIKNIYLNESLIKQYDYDNYNELIEEKNYDLNTQIEYLYDNTGNLLKKIEKNLQTNEVLKISNYNYNNENWEDQLTSYNDNDITYDQLGNIVSFNNNSFLWKNGVELSEIRNIIENKNLKFKYDENGIRKSKIYNGLETKYYTLNDEIVYEDRNDTVIYYLYDAEGLIGFKYNNKIFYYLKNLHNDIIGIFDEEGNKIVTYIYDSWGKLLSIKGENGNDISNDLNHIGNINPFRYRSYYYDLETGLYYLNHRYYNPELGRFISPDVVLGANEDILSYNLYAYVSNNPIVNYDKTGNGKFLNNLFSAIVNLFSKSTKKKVKEQAKKKNKKSSTASFCNNSTPSGAVSKTSGVSKNKKIVTQTNKGSISTVFGTCDISADHNFGNYGYDVGPTSADFYISSTTGDTTVKNTFDFDDDYIYFGVDVEIETGDNESVSGYTRINIKKEVALFSVALVPLTIVAYPYIKTSATAIKALGDSLKLFTDGLKLLFS